MGQAPLFEEPTLSVGELSAAIGRVLARAFSDEVWVRGEIANLKRRAEVVYFDLVDGTTSLPVVLWNNDRVVVNQVLKRAGGAVRMTEGTDVRIRTRVGWFGKRGTVSLRMLSIDPAYTLGQLAEAKERLLAALRADGTLARNATRTLSPVPLRVGLLTSAGSAAAADFLKTLDSSGRGFAVTHVDVRVQGVDAVASIVAGLQQLARRADSLDVVCVVRGGGARTDLAAFDDEAICRAIAAMPLPIFTGIGHEIDTCVADHAAPHVVQDADGMRRGPGRTRAAVRRSMRLVLESDRPIGDRRARPVAHDDGLLGRPRFGGGAASRARATRPDSTALRRRSRRGPRGCWTTRLAGSTTRRRGSAPSTRSVQWRAAGRSHEMQTARLCAEPRQSPRVPRCRRHSSTGRS